MMTATVPTVAAVSTVLKDAWLHETGDRLRIADQNGCVTISVNDPNVRDHGMPLVLTDPDLRAEQYANETDLLLDQCADELGKQWPVRRVGLELLVGDGATADGDAVERAADHLLRESEGIA